MRRIVLAVGLVLFVALAGFLAAIVLSRPETTSGPGPEPMTYTNKRGDSIALELLYEIQDGDASADRSTPDA